MNPQESDENAHVKASALIREIAELPGRDTITVGEFISLLGDRSFALSILIFSLPNSLPIPGIPGFSTVTGLPILFIALQMIAGRSKIWLPKRVAEKSFSYAFLKKIVEKATPPIIWLEQYIRPRATFLCGSLGERCMGVLITVMSFILVLPIVGGNFLPGASISMMALALLENDGIFASISVIVCLLSIYIMFSIVVWAVGHALAWAMALM